MVHWMVPIENTHIVSDRAIPPNSRMFVNLANIRKGAMSVKTNRDLMVCKRISSAEFRNRIVRVRHG